MNTDKQKESWTTADFPDLSWHDNHVHGFKITEGQHGSGELILDLDFIEEWINSHDKGFRFLIQPATLSFHEVTDLVVSLSYKAVSAALGPFAIHTINRKYEQREHYVAQLWTIEVNWPEGEICFEATGFTQTRNGPSVLADGQHLERGQRE